jgi:hypothetical protein
MASIYRKKNGDVWYYSITYQGKHYQGTTRTTDKKSAQLIAESIQTDLAREKHSLPTLTKKVANFAALFDEYIRFLSNSKETIKNKMFAYRHFTFKNKDITAITAQDIEYYLYCTSLSRQFF